jgi:hypothetical protein
LTEVPQRAWDRFSGSHFAGLNDYESLREACGVLRGELEKALDASNLPIDDSEYGPVLDVVFGKVKADA